MMKIYFQLRFQHNDSNAITGQLTLNLTDWINFLSNPNLHKFCLKLSERFKLPDNYIENIENYYFSSQIPNKKPRKAKSDSYIFRTTDDTESETTSDEEATSPVVKKF